MNLTSHVTHGDDSIGKLDDVHDALRGMSRLPILYEDTKNTEPLWWMDRLFGEFDACAKGNLAVAMKELTGMMGQ